MGTRWGHKTRCGHKTRWGPNYMIGTRDNMWTRNKVGTIQGQDGVKMGSRWGQDGDKIVQDEDGVKGQDWDKEQDINGHKDK